jgi:hypothetical protein
MVNLRLFGFVSMLVIAMIAVQADAALSGKDAAWAGLTAPEPNHLLLLLLGGIVPFGAVAAWGMAPARRRRVNRARLRARRARP